MSNIKGKELALKVAMATIADVKNHNEKLSIELGKAQEVFCEINSILECIAEAPEINETDSHAVKGVKMLAHRVRKAESDLTALRGRLEDIKKCKICSAHRGCCERNSIRRAIQSACKP